MSCYDVAVCYVIVFRQVDHGKPLCDVMQCEVAQSNSMQFKYIAILDILSTEHCVNLRNAYSAFVHARFCRCHTAYLRANTSDSELRKGTTAAARIELIHKKERKILENE